MPRAPGAADDSAGRSGSRAAVGKARGGVVTYSEGQHCGSPGCTTLLSRYNPIDVCAQHDPKRIPDHGAADPVPGR